MSPLLKIGVIWAFFHKSGNILKVKDLFNKINKGKIDDKAQFFTNKGRIPLGSAPLPTSSP